MGRIKEGLAGFFEDDYGLPSGIITLDEARASLYPRSPGFKERGGTSEEAAVKIAPRVRKCHEVILEVLRRRGRLTADEIAVDLGMTILYVRPRVAELRKLGKIRKVEGKRGTNASGMSAAKWEVVP